MSTKQLDVGLSNYYSHSSVSYDKQFSAWAEDNGYDTDLLTEEFDTNLDDEDIPVIIEFDDQFPTNKTGKEKGELIFNVLLHCWNTPNAFQHSLESGELQKTPEIMNTSSPRTKADHHLKQKQQTPDINPARNMYHPSYSTGIYGSYIIKKTIIQGITITSMYISTKSVLNIRI